MFRKKDPPPKDPDDVLSAVLMPTKGVSDQQLMSWLIDNGVKQPSHLAAGFVSVRAKRSTLEAAKSMATIEIKSPKQMR